MLYIRSAIAAKCTNRFSFKKDSRPRPCLVARLLGLEILRTFWNLPFVFELLTSAFKTGETPLEWQAQLESIDQDALAVSAIVLGLAPLLHWRLTEWGVSLAPRAMAKLAATREMARAQRRALDMQLDQTLTALDANHVETILLKGNYLGLCVYPEAHLRQMNDIDLLVRPQNLERTEAALLDLGYIATYKSSERGAGVVKHTSTFRPPRADDPTPNPYLSSLAGRTIEPHVSLQESWYGLEADVTPGVWERSIPFPVLGHAVRALAADDLLLHLGVHLTFHLIMGYPSMVQLLDLLLTTQRLQNEIHWDTVVARAKERHAAPFVYAALHLAVKTLDAPVPAFVLEQLGRACSKDVRQYAEAITLANVVSRTQRAPVTTFGQRLRRGWQDRVEVARWTSTLSDRWQVWRTFVDVANTDTGELIAQRLRGTFVRGAAKNISTNS